MAEQYVSVGSNLEVLSEKLDKLPSVDTLVFDIDGVVLDVRGSFRVAISQTVQFYFSQILKWPGSSTLITPEETQLFKLAGGFNNDWDLTFAAVLFFLSKAHQSGSQDLDELRKNSSELVSFTNKVRAEGGGLERARELTLESWDLRERRRILKEWDMGLIRKVFQEHYGGTDYCEKLYGFFPSYVKQKGLIGQEKLLLDSGLAGPWYPRIGVVTGRTKSEAEVALEISGLKALVSRERVVADEGDSPRKPDPEVLRILAERMGSSLGIYFGDTPDDLATVENYDKLAIPSSFISCIIIHREGERDFYLAREADILARSVNDVLIFLKKVKG